jgi:hypothetical protein
MSDLPFDPERFFDSFPRFVDSSETGPWLDRLNARYLGLIHAQRDVFPGTRVLDLASHDGRFSFAALANGAREVVGVDVKDDLVAIGMEHFASYGIEPSRYSFLVGDLFDAVHQAGSFDVVLCFGILYHICDHMLLFNLIAEANPRVVLIDTNVSSLPGSVIEVRSPLAAGPPELGSQLEGHPSPLALHAMLASFGWEVSFVDWAATGLTDRPHMQDYRAGTRATAVVTCPEHSVPTEVREQAVQQVLQSQDAREQQYLVVSLVAKEHGLAPQALAAWVRQAERARWQAAGFGPSTELPAPGAD